MGDVIKLHDARDQGFRDLAAELARMLDETWIFQAMWAQTYAKDAPDKRICDLHAAVMAHVHAAMVKAHAAGVFHWVPTVRIPEILKEHGYNAEALAARPIPKGGSDA